jgi:hypothetical protein
MRFCLDPTFAAPSMVARHDACLLVVNSQLDRLGREPVLPFTVSSVPLPAVANPDSGSRR